VIKIIKNFILGLLIAFLASFLIYNLQNINSNLQEKKNLQLQIIELLYSMENQIITLQYIKNTKHLYMDKNTTNNLKSTNQPIDKILKIKNKYEFKRTINSLSLHLQKLLSLNKLLIDNYEIDKNISIKYICNISKDMNLFIEKLTNKKLTNDNIEDEWKKHKEMFYKNIDNLQELFDKLIKIEKNRLFIFKSLDYKPNEIKKLQINLITEQTDTTKQSSQ